MENINNVRKLTRASMLLVFALIIILIGSRFGGVTFNSFVVGPLVNGVIITTVLITDTKFGILVGICTPILAVLTGQLAAPMVPFSPFIMLGNATYALLFGISYKYIKNYGSYAGIALGAVFKMIILLTSVKYLVPLFGVNIPKPVLTKLSVMMSYPQIITAVSGGIVALIFYSIYKRTYAKA